MGWKMTFVTLKGLNHRGKGRVATFGQDSKFVLLDTACRVRPNAILVESIEKKFRIGSELTTWSGWLEVGKEVEVLKTEILNV